KNKISEIGIALKFVLNVQWYRTAKRWPWRQAERWWCARSAPTARRRARRRRRQLGAAAPAVGYPSSNNHQPTNQNRWCLLDRLPFLPSPAQQARRDTQ